MEYKSWRTFKEHRPPKLEKKSDAVVIPATKIFDQLYFIGDEWVSCFALETSKGIVLIDCMEPGEHYVELIENAFKELGLDITKLTDIVITHGHHDHWGVSDIFRDKYGCKLWMSEIDDVFAHDTTHWRPPGFPSLTFDIDVHYGDGEELVFGDTVLKAYHTPGHTPGCMSLLIPVTDEGRPHLLSLWGGTGVTREAEEQQQYLDSCGRFIQICKDEHVDGEITNHPFVDNSKERLAVIRNIVNGVPNPFILGTEGVVYYQNMYREMCLDRMRRLKEEQAQQK